MRREPPPIDLEFDLPYPLEKVWRALATPELRAVWLTPDEADKGPPATCEVIEIDEKRRRMRLAWAADEEESSTVRFELTATPTGTMLRIVHDGFGAAVSAAEQASLRAPAQPPRLRSTHRRAKVRANPNATRMQWAA
jgi:uncharacterized protein YndB with AHSA1/START domain